MTTSHMKTEAEPLFKNTMQITNTSDSGHVQCNQGVTAKLQCAENTYLWTGNPT